MLIHHITTLPPGPKASRIVNRMKDLSYQSTYNYPLVIASGHGCTIEDVDGNRYLDFTSNIRARHWDIHILT
jgi:4-aminobutyrate aminotransferase